jgi:acyl-homoserine lactone synthase
MEIHVVDKSNAHLYRDMLDENFRLRAAIFIEEMKWSALSNVNGRERDQFDDDTATYYFAVEGDRLVGGIRRHCSLDPTLLSDVFPHLATRGFERAANIYEVTRLYIAKEARGRPPCRVAGYLQRALWGHSLIEGGSATQFVTWASYVPLLARSGLRPSPLGMPTRHEDMQLMAVRSPIDERVLAELTAYYDLGPAPFLTEGLDEARAAA